MNTLGSCWDWLPLRLLPSHASVAQAQPAACDVTHCTALVNPQQSGVTATLVSACPCTSTRVRTHTHPTTLHISKPRFKWH